MLPRLGFPSLWNVEWAVIGLLNQGLGITTSQIELTSATDSWGKERWGCHPDLHPAPEERDIELLVARFWRRPT